jgi:dephospho-CoA kinase
MAMSIIIGIAGETGSGKGAFVEYLKHCVARYIVRKVSSSDILNETLDTWDMEKTRSNLQKLAIAMDKEFGQGTLTHAVARRINETFADIVVFDGVRWESDVDMIRSYNKNLLVYITADVKKRYERARNRKEKIGEAFASLDNFIKSETVSTESNIPLVGAKADVKIENNGTTDEFREMIEKFCSEKVIPLLQKE